MSRGLNERAELLQVDKVRKGILDRRERERVKEAQKAERLQRAQNTTGLCRWGATFVPWGGRQGGRK